MDYGFVEPDFSGPKTATIRGSVVHLVAKNTDAVLTKADEKRMDNILLDAAKRAIRKIEKDLIIDRDHYTKISKYISSAFEYALKKECDLLIKASKTKPSVINAIEECKAIRGRARKEKAEELKSARKKLRETKWKIQSAELIAEKLVQEHSKESRKIWADKLRSAKIRLNRLQEAHTERSRVISTHAIMNQHMDKDYHGYPCVPKATTPAAKCNDDFPASPGIYFFWNGEVVEYVGQSINLSNRLKLGHHHVLRTDHVVSFVSVNRPELTWAECYYIGLLRPQLNFGVNASHNKYET
jgi:hypothetical protein